MGSRPSGPLLRGRARPLAKLDDADEAGIVVGQRQRTSPVTTPRRGVRQIGSDLRPACLAVERSENGHYPSLAPPKR